MNKNYIVDFFSGKSPLNTLLSRIKRHAGSTKPTQRFTCSTT